MSETKTKAGLTSSVRVRIDASLLSLIDQVAHEYKLSRSELIRRVLDGSIADIMTYTHTKFRYIDSDQAQIINKNVIALGSIIIEANELLRKIGVNFNQLVHSINTGQIRTLQNERKLITREELDGIINRLEIVSKKLGDDLYVLTNN